MTEKQYAPTKLNKQSQKTIKNVEKGVKPAVAKIVESQLKKEEIVGEEKIGEITAEAKENETFAKEEKEIAKEKKKEGEKAEVKKPAKKIKKEEVCVNAKSVPVSTKYAINICKFLKGKRIGDAIRDLEQVVLLKKPIPMKGEYSHKKGRGMSGGAYPQRASEQFIVLLKSLAGNANNHEISEPIIFEASANWAPAPRGRFGRVRRKRTHITLKAKEMKIKEKKK
jgi:large subunit ribosomal protein L22